MKVIGICAGVLWAVSAFGQCVLFETPIDCRNRLASETAERARKNYEEAVQNKMELNKEIAEARAKFWATYPNKPGAAEAQKRFADLLYQKDIYYLALNQYPQNRTGTRDTAAIADLFDRYGGEKIDHGIPRSAQPEFQDWSKAFQKNLAARGGVFSLNAVSNYLEAMAVSEREYRIYLLERDWAEFDAAGRVPVGYEKPDAYAAMLYFRFGKIPVPDAFNEMSSMAKLLGEDVVVRAAQEVRAAPKTAAGTLVITAREPLKTGPGGSKLPDDSIPAPENVIGSFGDPLSAFEALATRGDDRAYLLGLLAAQKPTLPRQSRHSGKWEYARQAYDRYVSAFGAQEVLEASHTVRVAVKRMIDGLVMDPKAIGVTPTRMVPLWAFENVLAHKDPRGHVRSMLAFNQQLNSKAEVDAAYQKFAAGREPAVLEAVRKMAALDFRYRGERPEVTAEADLSMLTAELNGSRTLDKPAVPMFDNPEYVAWKGFSAGAKASYVFRGMLPPPPGSTEWTGGTPSVRSTYTLQSINEEQARLWLTEIAYDYPSGAAHQARDSERAYSAKIPAAARRAPAGGQRESGQETLDINGRRIATRWESVPSTQGSCTIVTKTWTSDAVPSGLVRKTEDNACGGRRFIRETILESFEGVRQPGFTNVLPGAAEAPAVVSGPAPPPEPDNRMGKGKHAAPLPAPTPTTESGSTPTPAPAPVYEPNPEFPNYDLTEESAAKGVARYCHDIYDPSFVMLSPEQVKFAYANRPAIDADVKKCTSWFDTKRIMADRKVAMRYCLVNHNFEALRGAQPRAAYDACMNQNDILTALCTQELKNRTAMNRKRGIDEMDGVCPGAAPPPRGREYFVVVQGGSQDFGHFVVPAAGPGLPVILQNPLPAGTLHEEPRSAAAAGPAPPPPNNSAPVPSGAPAAAASASPAVVGASAQNVPPPGTAVDVRLIEAVDSGRDPAGKQYRAVVTKAMSAGNIVIAQGAAAAVTLAKDPSGWAAKLVSVVINNQVVAVNSTSATVTGNAQNAAANAAAVNSVVGGIFRRKTTTAPPPALAVTTGQRVLLPPGVTLSFTLGGATP